VDDAPAIGGVERLRDLPRDAKRVVERDGAFRDSIGECRSVHQLHHQRACGRLPGG
jgi:hypothetical protein